MFSPTDELMPNRQWENRLFEPFLELEHEWRAQQAGVSANGNPWVMVLCYVTARACQSRLDEVFGIDGWRDEYVHLPNGVQCTIHFRSPSTGEWCSKTNGAPETAVEAFKGGFSKSFVRCCSNLGIGRYLYNLTENFAKVVDQRTATSKSQCIKGKNGQRDTWVNWEAPSLPAWAIGK